MAISSLSRSEFVGWISNNVADYTKLIALLHCKFYANEVDCIREHSTYDELSNNLQNILKENSDLKEALSKYKDNIVQLNSTIRKKEKIVGDYEERFEKMEEEIQTVLERVNPTLDTTQLQIDIKNLREEKELIQISKEKHINDLIQLNIDNKKRITILENNIKTLIKEKNEIEVKLNNKKLSVKFKQWANQETQTEGLTQSEEKEHEYASLINEELNKLREKYASTNKELKVVKEVVEERDKELKEAKKEIERLRVENADLKVRRETAMEEIKRLNVNLLKLNCQPTDFSSACKKKVRYSSEAVSLSI
jgi:chromosome segregation ATPase